MNKNLNNKKSIYNNNNKYTINKINKIYNGMYNLKQIHNNHTKHLTNLNNKVIKKLEHPFNKI